MLLKENGNSGTYTTQCKLTGTSLGSHHAWKHKDFWILSELFRFEVNSLMRLPQVVFRQSTIKISLLPSVLFIHLDWCPWEIQSLSSLKWWYWQSPTCHNYLAVFTLTKWVILGFVSKKERSMSSRKHKHNHTQCPSMICYMSYSMHQVHVLLPVMTWDSLG